MPIRSGIIVAIKCLMVVLAFNTLLGGLTVLAAADMAGGTKIASVAIVFLLFIPILLVYWGAGWIVDVMTPKADEARPETNLTRNDLQAIAFSAVGAFILYTALRDTVALLTILPRLSPTDEGFVVQNGVRAAVAWIAGLYLLIGAPGIRRWVGSLRRAGPRGD